MKFDSKYLIQWGIPGWTIIFGVGVYILLTMNFENSMLNGMVSNSAGLLSIMISMIVVSVPIGYLIHQIYFVFDFYSSHKKRRVIKDILSFYTGFNHPNNWNSLTLNERYFLLEHEWHLLLLQIEQSKRDFIEGRYRYLLTTKHALGVLRFSLGTVVALVVIYQIWYMGSSNLLWFFFYTFMLLILFLLTWLNFKYYSQNLNTTQGKFMDDIKKDHLKDEC